MCRFVFKLLKKIIYNGRILILRIYLSYWSQTMQRQMCQSVFIEGNKIVTERRNGIQSPNCIKTRLSVRGWCHEILKYSMQWMMHGNAGMAREGGDCRFFFLR